MDFEAAVGGSPEGLALSGMCQTLIANTAYQTGRPEAGSRSHLRNLRPRRNDLKPNETHDVVSTLSKRISEQHKHRPALLLQRQPQPVRVCQSTGTGTECTFLFAYARLLQP